VVPSITAYSRDPGTGALTIVQQLSDGSDFPAILTIANSAVVSPDGAHLYIGRLDNFLIFDRDGITGELTFNDIVEDGVGGVVGLRGSPIRWSGSRLFGNVPAGEDQDCRMTA
jgi:hypothetical protein